MNGCEERGELNVPET